MRKRWKKAMLMAWAGGAGVAYLLLDRFTTDATGPLSSPRTCDPGPGSVTVTQTDGQFATSGGKCVITAQATPNWGRLGMHVPSTGTAVTRATGRTLGLKWKSATTIDNDAIVGFGDGTAANYTKIVDGLGLHFINTNFGPVNSAGSDYSVQQSGRVANVEDQVYIVLRSTGAFFVAQNKLVWPHATGNTANLYPFWTVNLTPTNSTADDFLVADAGGAWATDYGIATARIAVSSANDTIATTADGFVEHTFTAQTGVTKEILFRYQDATNHWKVSCNQGGSTMDLIEVNAGTPTTRNTVARTWVNGTSYRVVIRFVAAQINTYDEAAAGATNIRNSYASATFLQTQTGALTDHAGTNFIAWPLTVTPPAV